MIQLKDHWATSAQTTGPWQHVAAEQGRHDRSLARRLGTNGNDDGQVHRRSSYGCKDISQLIQCRDEGVHGGVRLKQLKLGGAGRDTDEVTLPKRDERDSNEVEPLRCCRYEFTCRLMQLEAGGCVGQANA